jgi:hypothetical protein
MKYDKLEHFVSVPRLDRFLTATNNSKSKAQELYKANLRVAESFYPILHLFEIFLRNTINYRLTKHFGNPDWIVTEKSGFMNNESLKSSKYFLREQVKGAEKRVKRRGGTITSGKIIAEQMLGFWTSLFDTHHYKLLAGTIIHCFPNRPANAQRKEINLKLDKIREFRNRIYHNEPVCFKDVKIDFTEAITIKEDIFEILNWVDSELASYVKQFDHIDEEINRALSIKSS